MKIAIIGAGWVGCHLASKITNHEVDLYEAEGIFSQTSYKNQNRLHLGYHYARSHSTRDLCLRTFKKFVKDYGHLTETIEKNIYAVPNEESIMDFGTYSKIFDNYDHQQISLNSLQNIDGAILVKEMFINPFKAKKHFTQILGNKIIYKTVTSEDLEEMSNNYDLVINCTNNALSPISNNIKFEACEVLVYKKINKTQFDAITFVDGNLFSIYPYQDDLFTVTHVEVTPDKTMSTDSKIKVITENIKKYYPDFEHDFKFHHSFKSNKVKYINGADSRVPQILCEKNIITLFTGKIQGIYDIEDYINKKIIEAENGK